ncbi:MAG: hypothetical protein ACI9W6_002221, partial [Motiliproteus sp.]
KRFSADGSVGSPHVRVGHRQAPNTENPQHFVLGVFSYWRWLYDHSHMEETESAACGRKPL